MMANLCAPYNAQGMCSMPDLRPRDGNPRILARYKVKEGKPIHVITSRKSILARYKAQAGNPTPHIMHRTYVL